MHRTTVRVQRSRVLDDPIRSANSLSKAALSRFFRAPILTSLHASTGPRLEGPLEVAADTTPILASLLGTFPVGALVLDQWRSAESRPTRMGTAQPMLRQSTVVQSADANLLVPRVGLVAAYPLPKRPSSTQGH